MWNNHLLPQTIEYLFVNVDMFFFREDDNDKSDDDEEGRIDFSINTFAKERQKIHNDFLAVEHGMSKFIVALGFSVVIYSCYRLFCPIFFCNRLVRFILCRGILMVLIVW